MGFRLDREMFGCEMRGPFYIFYVRTCWMAADEFEVRI